MFIHKSPVVHLVLENGSNMFFEVTGTTYPKCSFTSQNTGILNYTAIKTSTVAK